MDGDVGYILACLIIFVICVWAVWHGCKELRAQVKSGKAVDQTLGEVDRSDAPNMYGLQVLGFVLLIGVSALVSIGAVVALLLKLAGP